MAKLLAYKDRVDLGALKLPGVSCLYHIPREYLARTYGLRCNATSGVWTCGRAEKHKGPHVAFYSTGYRGETHEITRWVDGLPVMLRCPDKKWVVWDGHSCSYSHYAWWHHSYTGQQALNVRGQGQLQPQAVEYENDVDMDTVDDADEYDEDEENW